MTPRVSVIVPTRNRLKQLQRALASVERQTFGSYEVIVIDDGSIDATRDWVAARGSDTRLISLTVSAGAAAARNRGVEQSRSELVAFLDDDDVWSPAYLEHQVRNLDADARASLSWASHLEVDARGRTRAPDTSPLLSYSSELVRMLAESFIHTMSVVACRRTLFDQHGPFDERLSVVQDLEWYARLLGTGHTFVHLAHTLVGRSVPGGLVTRHREWAEEERHVVAAALAAADPSSHDRQLVVAYRALFFAHLGFVRMDLPFAMARLAEAIQASPKWTVRVAASRLARRAARWRLSSDLPEFTDRISPATR